VSPVLRFEVRPPTYVVMLSKRVMTDFLHWKKLYAPRVSMSRATWKLIQLVMREDQAARGPDSAA
jgi:hypothetical protein